MEKIPKLKPRKGCDHNLTRKLYYQQGGKWITTTISMCMDCTALIDNKQEVRK